MVMAAKFYTEAKIKTVRAKAVEISADGVAKFYDDIGSQFGPLFTIASAFGNHIQR